MKRKNVVRCVMKVTLMCMCFWLAVVLFGCSTDLGLNPENGVNTPANAVSTNPNGGQLIPESALKFIDLPLIKGRDGIAGTDIYVEEDISVEEGGKIHLNYNAPGKDDIHVNSMLDVDPYTVTSDMTVSLSLPQEHVLAEVDIVFGPSGTVFTTSAEFKLEANNVNLSHVDNPEDIGFYYYHEDSGLWELLDGEIKVNLENGHINARVFIDHFSRYALAVSR